VTGQPDGPPTLPPFFLADGVASQSATAAVMLALYHRDVHGAGGQILDLSLYESLMQLLGPLPMAWDQLAYLQPRMGSRLPYSVPRNAYRCKDGKWVALSASAQSVAMRMFDAIERPELKDDPRFATHVSRIENVEAIDEAIAEWIGLHTRDEALASFERHDAALAPIYDMSEFFADRHVVERGSLETVDDPDWGLVRMQGVHPRFSETPGRIGSAGPSELGPDNDAVYAELGLGAAVIEKLRADGVI